MSATGPQKIRVRQQDIAYRIDGPSVAPVVLLVHGVLTDHRAWDAVADRLASKFRVLRYDLRGHGGSSAPPPPYTMEELGDDVPALLDALGIDKAHVAGSSLGGMIAQQVGARHPQRLLSLTLANTAAVQATPAAWEERAAAVRQAGSVAALADPTMQRWFTPAFIEKAPDTIARMRGILLETSADGYVGCATAISKLAQLELLPRIKAPTLVIAGSEDKATPPEQAKQIADAVPGARLVTLPAAHQAAVEQSQAFGDAWLSFVGGLGG